MKKSLTLMLLMFILLNANSQNPYQIVDTTKSWNTISIGFYAWNIAHCGGTTTNKFLNSQNFNGNTYREVYEIEDSTQTNWSQVGLIREDTVNKRVYYSDGYSTEGLLYDFSISTGDTVVVENAYRDFISTLVCETIDTVFISGEPKKRFSFYAVYQSRDFVVETWIEGIGSLYGVLNSGLGGSGFCGGTNELLCCKKNNTIIYFNTTYNSCYIETFYPQIVQDEYDTAFVNTLYTFQVQIDTGNALSFSFIGDVIPENFAFDPSTGILYGNPTQTGSFACVIRVTNNNLNLFTGIINNVIVVVLPEVMNNMDKEMQTHVFPNPFTRETRIELSDNSEACILNIVNQSGKVVLHKMLSEKTTRLFLPMLTKGIYFFRFSNNNSKLIKVIPVVKN